MPTFEIEERQLYVNWYRVEAETEAEAVQKLGEQRYLWGTWQDGEDHGPEVHRVVEVDPNAKKR